MGFLFCTDIGQRTNAENDVLLHRLVHTQLLSGSTNPGLDMKPAQQRKALSGRVIELAEGAKLGKGEKVIRDSERNKAGKRVREGLVRKQQERQKQKLDEVFLVSPHLQRNSVYLIEGQEYGELSPNPEETIRDLKYSGVPIEEQRAQNGSGEIPWRGTPTEQTRNCLRDRRPSTL